MAVPVYRKGPAHAAAINFLSGMQALDPNSQANQLNRLKLEGQRIANELAQRRLDAGGRGDDETMGLNALFALDAAGNPIAYQLGNRGSLSQIQFPEGVTPTVPTRDLDLGDVVKIMTRGGQVIDEYQKGVPTQQTPEYKADVKAAETEAVAEAQRMSPENIAKTQNAIAEAQGVLDDIEIMLTPRTDVKGKLNLSYAYGRSNVLIPDAAKPAEWIDAEARRDRIASNLQLANVSKLKGTGPITENEQKILARAASALTNPLISDKLAEAELKRVRDMFARWAKESAALLPAEPAPVVAPAQTGTRPMMTDQDYEAERRRILGGGQ